jgi:hypothetical protein
MAASALGLTAAAVGPVLAGLLALAVRHLVMSTLMAIFVGDPGPLSRRSMLDPATRGAWRVRGR